MVPPAFALTDLLVWSSLFASAPGTHPVPIFPLCSHFLFLLCLRISFSLMLGDGDSGGDGWRGGGRVSRAPQ